MLDPVDNEPFDFEAWMSFGYENGWIGAPVCYTHDGLPTSNEEDASFEDGSDPCMHVLRLYDDLDHKTQVEENHSASVWRASNRGLLPDAGA
jgi:hypothetical protein